jgi:hypothetical protein
MAHGWRDAAVAQAFNVAQFGGAVAGCDPYQWPGGHPYFPLQGAWFTPGGSDRQVVVHDQGGVIAEPLALVD